jgi:hypothetical protein
VGGGVGGKEADALSRSGAELGVMGLLGEGATTAISDSRRRSGGGGGGEAMQQGGGGATSTAGGRRRIQVRKGVLAIH